MLGACVPRAVVIVVAEIPGRAGQDRPTAASADHAAGRHARSPDFAEPLMWLAVASLRARFRLRPGAHARLLSLVDYRASGVSSRDPNCERARFSPFAAKPWPLVGLSVAFHQLIGGMTQTGVFWDCGGVRRTPTKKPVGLARLDATASGLNISRGLWNCCDLMIHSVQGNVSVRAGVQPAKGDVVIA